LYLRLLTFNIRSGSGCEDMDKPGYDLPTSTEKLTALADAIGAVNPDLVALQEVRSEFQAESIARLLGMNFVYKSHPLGYRLYFFQWGLAFLYRFKVIETGSQPILFDKNVGIGRTGLLGKMNIYGRAVTFINLHFDHKEGAKQVQNVLRWLDDVTPPVVLLGDLNCRPDDPLLKPFEHRLADTCQMVHTDLSREANVRGTLLKEDIRVDYIWVEPQFFTVQEVGLIPESHRKVSDHIGYFADIVLK